MYQGRVIPCLHSPLLQAAAGIRHGFFTRVGGTSTGLYHSLNCSFGSSDDAAAVAANRARVASACGVEDLYTAKQVHGTGVVFADLERPDPGCEGDALVSATPGVSVAVMTADCVPVLLADPDAGVVAAVHAGWRGAVAGVVGAAIEAMESRGARRENIRAAVGPAIQQRSYEVGAELREAVFTGVGFDVSFLFESSADRFLFDLPGFVRIQCVEAGVTMLDNLGIDTYEDAERFFSYRRAGHLGEGDYGRQISVIGIPAARDDAGGR